MLFVCCVCEAPLSIITPNSLFGEVFTPGFLAGGVTVPYFRGQSLIFIYSVHPQSSLYFIWKFFVCNTPVNVFHCSCSQAPSLAVSLQLVSVLKFEIGVLFRIFYVHDFLISYENSSYVTHLLTSFIVHAHRLRHLLWVYSKYLYSSLKSKLSLGYFMCVTSYVTRSCYSQHN